MDSSSENGTKKRTRKWHHRGFSGCSTCKKRHVKCDETVPACLNCTKRGLDCDGSHQNATFKVYMQSPSTPTADQDKKNHETTPAAYTSINNYMQSIDIKKEAGLPSNYPLSQNGTSSFDPEGTYYSYFVDTVSTFLVIYDTPYNSNPFRNMFPRYACTSRTLTKAMSAVGALHLANTTTGQNRSTHVHYAMNIYGEIVQFLRQAWSSPDYQFRLTDSATCLLLCIFEMLDSQTENWRVHLAGARDIFESLNSPTTTMAHKQADILDQPFKRFLVSLMAYLDVTGAVSTNEKMVGRGPYWEMYGSGQQQTFGVPMVPPEFAPDGAFSNDLRHAWNALRSIREEIISFSAARRHGISMREQDAIRQGLEDRLASWEATGPDAFSHLSQFEDMSDMLENSTLLESIACVKAHEQATVIYLHRVSVSGYEMAHHSLPHIRIAASRILALARSHAKGVGRLAIVWAMYMAGLEVVGESDRAFVREWYQETIACGLKTANKALNTLEYFWCNKGTSKLNDWVEVPNI